MTWKQHPICVKCESLACHHGARCLHPESEIRPAGFRGIPVEGSNVFRFGDSRPTPRAAYKLTVVRPGEPERELVVLGHVPLSAAMLNAGMLSGGVLKVEPVEV